MRTRSRQPGTEGWTAVGLVATAKGMKTELRIGERLLRDGAANLQRGVETVGGRLHLTTERLVFESHRFNVQTGVTAIELGDIASVEPCWTRFLGLIPLAPNSLALTLRDGTVHRFVLWGREQWRTAIEQRSAAAGR